MHLVKIKNIVVLTNKQTINGSKKTIMCYQSSELHSILRNSEVALFQSHQECTMLYLPALLLIKFKIFNF